MTSLLRRRPLRAGLLAAAGLSLALSACKPEDVAFWNREAPPPPRLPLTLDAPPPPLALAPDPLELPPAPPARVGRLASYNDGYAWAERAYALDAAFYQAPPDYGFYYDDVQPWVWETEDDWELYAEPIDQGYRYYYYEPQAAYPYFVRDDEFGYGYDDVGRLVIIYDLAGRILPQNILYERADHAGRYWARAKALRRAAERERRVRIEERQWRARRPVVVETRAAWIEAAAREDRWRAYRERTGERELRRFREERERREQLVARQERAEER
ncbi:MAG: hypothetical protein PHG43_08810, partial [Phenylobacterium sp.]|nr:hypothetical protein [Phenylobacterium sp.]